MFHHLIIIDGPCVLVQAVAHGYHYYEAIWEAGIDEEVRSCEKEVGNVHNTLAICVKHKLIFSYLKTRRCK